MTTDAGQPSDDKTAKHEPTPDEAVKDEPTVAPTAKGEPPVVEETAKVTPASTWDPAKDAGGTPSAAAGRKKLLIGAVAGLAVLAGGIGVALAVSGDSSDTSAGRPEQRRPSVVGNAGGNPAPENANRANTTNPLENRPPVSDIDPKAIAQDLSQEWKLPLTPSANGKPQLTGGRTDEATGLITNATVTWGQDNKIRSMRCSAVEKAGAATLSANGVKFLTDCLTQAVEGAQQATLRTWLTQNLTGETVRLARTPAEAARERQVAVGDLQLEVSTRMGVTITLTTPAA